MSNSSWYDKIVNWLRKHYLITKLLFLILALSSFVLLIFDITYRLLKPIFQLFSIGFILPSSPISTFALLLATIILFLIYNTYSKFIEEDITISRDKSAFLEIRIPNITITTTQSTFPVRRIPVQVVVNNRELQINTSNSQGTNNTQSSSNNNNNNNTPNVGLIIERSEEQNEYYLRVIIHYAYCTNNRIDLLLHFTADGIVELGNEEGNLSVTRVGILSPGPYIAIGPEYSNYLETEGILTLFIERNNITRRFNLNARVLIKWNQRVFGDTVDICIGERTEQEATRNHTDQENSGRSSDRDANQGNSEANSERDTN